MTDEEAGPTYSYTLAHLGNDEVASGALLYMLNEKALGAVMFGQIISLLPDTSQWRLTITGDIVASVNEIEARDSENAYTTDRGAGHVGARTIRKDDETFDIVISEHVFFATREDVDGVDELVAHALSAGAHIALHEAGHAALFLRGEDNDHYQDLPQLDPTLYAWRKHLAAHMDDNRIEQMTTERAPSPLLQVDHLGEAITHLRDSLNEAKRTWRDDIGDALYRSMTAANSLIRVFAYLAAELGVEDGKAVRPAILPDGWVEYVEDSWDAWSLNFDRLKPADEPMTLEELAGVLSDLCRLADAWLRSIGVEYGMNQDLDEYVYWTNDRY